MIEESKMIKDMFLAYAIFNMDDGHDFMPIGVYDKYDLAVGAVRKFMRDSDDESLVNDISDKPNHSVVYNDWYTRSYNIESIKVHEVGDN